jgi:hypothetical protein
LLKNKSVKTKSAMWTIATIKEQKQI